MWPRTALLTALAILAGLPAEAETLVDFRGVKIDVPTSPTYVACFAAAYGSDLRMAECIHAETKLWDRRLNAAYGTLRAKLNKGDFAVLQTFQRAWIADRDAACRDSGQNGTMGRVVAASCNMRFTVLRAIELEMRAADGG